MYVPEVAGSSAKLTLSQDENSSQARAFVSLLGDVLMGK